MHDHPPKSIAPPGRWHRVVTAVVVVGFYLAAAALAVLGPVGAPHAGGPKDTTIGLPGPEASLAPQGSSAPSTRPAPGPPSRPAPPAQPFLPEVTTPPEPPGDDSDGNELRAASAHLAELGARFEADPRVAGFEVGVSVWQVDPDRELLAVGDARPLLPASVQKLATAAASLERLEPTFTFETRVVIGADGSPDGTVGDLVVVGGGDPTLGRSGPHSLDALAAQVHAAGIREVTGDVVVDADRWSDERAARGWLDWQQPRFVGWMSALLADANQWQTGPDAQEPELANGRVFRGALQRRGIVVGGEVRRGPAPADAAEVAVARSSARDDLVSAMVRRSDNTIAEALVRELGWQDTGQGSAESGTAVVSAVVADLVADGPRGRAPDVDPTASPSGEAPRADPTAAPDGDVGWHPSDDADGSGLSRQDRRSAAQWRALVVAAQDRSWWPVLRDALPEAARTGTLAGRFGGTAAAGNLRAKTGTTVPVRALSGVLAASDGSEVVFAVVVNGDDTHSPAGAEGAIDELLVALTAAPMPAVSSDN